MLFWSYLPGWGRASIVIVAVSAVEVVVVISMDVDIRPSVFSLLRTIIYLMCLVVPGDHLWSVLDLDHG
jgi:hypothetical protein